ncbi:MAG: hypothetical protein RXQ75_05400 [Acidianus hospitalis]
MEKFPISEKDLKMLNVNTSIDIIKDTVTCTLTKMKGDMRFYPALAVSSIVGKAVKNIFQVIRHGVVIQTPKGNYYYIGGASEYWESSIYAFQASVKFKNNTKHLADKMKGKNVVVIKVRKINSELPQFNPVEGYLPLEPTGAIMTNYLPDLTIRPFSDTEVPGELIYESNEHYTADVLSKILRAISTRPPFPYMVIATISKQATFKVPPAVQAYVPFPASVMDELCKFFLLGRFEKYCSELVSDTSYNEALIGAPVFTTSDCYKPVSLIGLVYDGEMLNNSFARLSVIEPPPHTDGEMLDYANKLGVGEILELSIRGEEYAKKGAKAISSAYGLSPVVANYITNYITWSENEDEMVREAEPYVELVRSTIKQVRKEMDEMGDNRPTEVIEECLARQDIEENCLEVEGCVDLYSATLECLHPELFEDE